MGEPAAGSRSRDIIAPMNLLALLKLFLLVMFFGGFASAQMDMKMYRQSISRGGAAEQVAKAYLGGAGTALGVANAHLASKHQPLLYCAPEKLPLNVSNLEPLIDQWIKEMSNGTPVDEIEKLPVAALLLNAMMDAFPCSKP